MDRYSSNRGPASKGLFARTLTLAGVLLLLFSGRACAYRPFDGTDAGVASARTLEVELGPVEYSRSGMERLLIVPSFSLAYGAGAGYEFSVDARRFMVMSPDAEGKKPKIDDVELSATRVLRNGSIQDKRGLSLAVETALLLPTADEKTLGAELSLVASHAWSGLALHLNGEVSKTRSDEFGRFASLIAEGPEWGHVRPAGEVSWSRDGDAAIARALLLGVIWQTRSGLAMDFAVLTGSADEKEVEIRSGITWNRHVSGPRI